MPKIDKKIRSFSPYDYNIQYNKAGGGPYQHARPYVNSARMPEEQYVVSKRTPEWFVYVTNDIYFLLNENTCRLQLDNIISNFYIVNKKEEVHEFFEDMREFNEIR